MEFSMKLSENVFNLHRDLLKKTYVHGSYQSFGISDPKPRKIHKATVRDRLLHHAIYRVAYPYFEKRFIYDSYSCRDNKGTHKAINRFLRFYREVSLNSKKTCWVLKCDVRKFFHSIDHEKLLEIITRHKIDAGTVWLISRVVKSFDSSVFGKGLPLGNLTSQLLVNIYMNELDQFVKHELKVKQYIRFADDFVILHKDRDYLSNLLVKIKSFLSEKLFLELHPNKVFVKTISSGVDFLGWVQFPKYRVLRTSTKRRMLKKLSLFSAKETVNSYLGLLKHGDTYKLREKIARIISLKLSKRF